MKTRLQAYAAGAIEASILMALLLVPIIINYYGFQIFARPKGALLVALGLLVASLGIVAAAEGGLGGLRSLLRRPLVAAALLTGLATLLATATSSQRQLSIWGSGERTAGLIQALALLAFFAGAAWIGRAPARRERILACMVAASVPVALYALTQALRLEVVPGRVESLTRAFGSLSNPIFLAAYMMLLLPLGLQRMQRAAREGAFLRLVGWGLVTLLQLAAMVASDSRGPFLGLAAAGLVALLALALRPGRRWLGFATLGLLVAGLAFLVVFNQPGSALAPLRELPVLGRFGEISTVAGDSSGARLRIWRSTRRLLVAEPARLLSGHGPETLKYALLPYGETYMAGYGQRSRLVDRAHDVLLDKLVMEGLPGALALLFLFGAWLQAAAVAAGLAPEPADRRRLAGLLAGGTGLGALGFLVGWRLPLFGEPLSVFAGALTLLGLVGGLLAYLVWRLLTGGGVASEAADDDAASAGLGLAFLALGAAAVVEAAFGIQVVETQLLIWILAGLLLALGLGRLPAVETAGRPAALRRQRRGETDDDEAALTLSIGWSPRSVGYGLLLGAQLGAIDYSLHIFGATPLAHTWLVLLLLLVGALLAGLLAAADAGEGLFTAALVALVVLALFLGLRALTLALYPDASLLWGMSLAWFLILALAAGSWLREPLTGAPGWRGPAGLVYPLLAVPGVALLVLAALNPVRADIYFQSALATFDAALARDDSQLLLDADTLYGRAARLNPREDGYPLLMAERYTQLGSLSGADLEGAATAFGRAQSLIEQAELLDPDMPFHKVNRGHLQLVFAQMLMAQQPEQARTVAANAALPLQEAFDAVPYDPAVAGELALARWLGGQPEQALPLLEYSRDTLDPDSPLTLRLLGQVYYDLERLDEAEAAFEKALGSSRLTAQERLSIQISLGEIARERGRLPEAIGYYEQVLAAGGGDWSLLYNLGLMYRDNGDTAKAREAWTQTLQAAPLDAYDQVQAALESLGQP